MTPVSPQDSTGKPESDPAEDKVDSEHADTPVSAPVPTTSTPVPTASTESAPTHTTHPTIAEPVPVPTPVLDTGYTESGVPTFDGVREKIETRYGTALGATELAEETPEVRSATDQFEARQKAAAAKLEEIRASMHKSEGRPGS